MVDSNGTLTGGEGDGFSRWVRFRIRNACPVIGVFRIKTYLPRIGTKEIFRVPSVFEEMILSGCTPDRKARAMLRSALRYMKQMLNT
ncbi:hypothetical protein Taro_028223 [Colocasia esculenta]|uniref:Uncharacterized protein n=1 Tax=Colocasia esculenta TaxID=4460 RepID=A0A843VFY5_COLES|nr:hypothetical protein [Colocasia esculenta]